jgi:transcriptional regulator with XRE-family HTH domain
MTNAEQDRLTMRHLSAAIRCARRKQGWTQVELGIAAGVHSVYISQLERGVRSATSVTTVVRIAQALGLPAGALLDGEWKP